MAFHVTWKNEGRPARALAGTADEAFRLAVLCVANQKQPLIAQIDEADLSAVERALLGDNSPSFEEETRK